MSLIILNNGIKQYTIQVKDYQLSCICRFISSSSEALLFLHGLACSKDSFRNLFDEDYFPNKSLIVLDLIGFGKSDKPEDFSYSVEDQAKIIEEFLSQFPQWTFHIVAHSMGGAVALLLSQKFLSNILSFTNIEGNLISDDCGILSRSIASSSYEKYRDEIFPQQVIEFKNHHQLRFEETTPNAVYKSAKSLVEWSDRGKLLDLFRDLRCKKCYFYGEANREMPVLEKLDIVQKFMIQNSGHGLMNENPTEFYSKLAEFISR